MSARRPARSASAQARVGTVSRRDILRWMAAGGVGVGVLGPLAVACAGEDDRRSGEAEPMTEAEAAIFRIGRRHREEHPDEDDVVVLREHLGLEEGELAGTDDLASFAELAAEDYGAGRTVRLDGWVLSVTEARAAALLSLS
ncbi:MAG: hypothetical protein AAGK32_17975 [Actinomycetota bacterium]